MKDKNWKKLVLRRVKENLGSAWRKGYQNEEGLDDEEEDILGMVLYAIAEYKADLKKKVEGDTAHNLMTGETRADYFAKGYNEAKKDIINLLKE